MKELIKQYLSDRSFRLYKYLSRHTLPWGLDLTFDIDRLSRDLPIRTIFDVGANIGQTAQEFHKNFSEADIFSFEPVSKTFQELEKNTRNLNRVKIFKNGFGGEEQSCKIYINPNSLCSTLLVEASHDVKDYEMIDIKTIDRFCLQNDIDMIDILKTDTEGFDLQVIQGAEQYLNEQRIKFIVSEVGFYESDKQHTYFITLLNYLTQKGFKFSALYDQNSSHPRSRQGLLYCNALFLNPKVIKRQLEKK
jgi:FkbM family methyltransferase